MNFAHRLPQGEEMPSEFIVRSTQAWVEQVEANERRPPRVSPDERGAGNDEQSGNHPHPTELILVEVVGQVGECASTRGGLDSKI